MIHRDVKPENILAVVDLDCHVWLPPGRLSALSVPLRFPMKIYFVWRFCMGAQGA